ncbi:MAG: FtsW/RodA/SpoVE family cell cycle protein [Lentisphaeria bacterium]|nr:FtsW/RodA/SpoVE family cell cycle protein [Lentisphaeria bacterium]
MNYELPLPQSYHKSKGLFPLGAALLLIVAGLLGCLAIYSSRAFADESHLFVFRQILWLAPGIVIFLFAAAIPFRFYRKAAFWLQLAALAALAGVLFHGTVINGMRGWFDLGICNLQPSEFAKSFFLLYLCVKCGPRKELTAGFWMQLLMMAILTGGLVMAEPDYGGTMVFFLIFLLVSVLNGAKLHYLMTAGGVMFLGTLFFLLSNDYAMFRIVGFLNPESAGGWHIRQFQYTLAHGGWTGSDWGNALWSGSFLPLPHTDSLFASIVESTGFLGGLLVIGGFLAMSIAFCSLSWKVRGDNHDRRCFIFSAGALYLMQALIHISVNCVLIPPTGVTLPILSYGGSSLLSVLLTFGIAFSAARSDESETLSTVPQTTGGEPHTDRQEFPRS